MRVALVAVMVKHVVWIYTVCGGHVQLWTAIQRRGDQNLETNTEFGNKEVDEPQAGREAYEWAG